MATIPSYPQANAGPEDLLLGINIIPDAGVDTPKTRSFPVSSIISLATAAVPAFIPSDYDLDEFTNENVDPFAKISDIPVLGYTPVNKAGDTMLGNLILNADPSNALGAATKQYVDNNVPVIQPVSATQTGVVNNSSLQELGGVDKTINGVRVGRGNFATTSNTAVGYQALQSNINTTGSEGRYNTAFGSEALKTLTTGYANDAFGQYALRLCETGTFNLAVGISAMSKSTIATQSTAIGQYALQDNLDGSGNTALGLSALQKNTNSLNTAIGTRAGCGVDGISNTGTQNIFIGYQAGGYISSGRNNLLIENLGLGGSITSGSYNIVLNPKQKSGVTTGSYNTIIGCWDGTFPTTMANNVIIGDGQGNIRFRTTDTGLTTVPGQTNTLVDGDTTGKAVVTKEYTNNRLVEEKTAGYTLTDADSGKIIIFKTTASQTLVIPTGLAAGFECTFVTLTGITLTVTSTGNTLNNAVGTTMTGGKRFMLKRMIATNTFVAMGDL